MATELSWVKSSYSSGQGGNCVEAARPGQRGVLVRDSKDPEGPKLAFTAREWKTFTRNIKAGGFDGLS